MSLWPAVERRRRDARRDARRRGAALIAAAALLAGAEARAHSIAPALLVLHERPPTAVDVTWKVPVLQVTGADLKPILPADCPAVGAATTTTDNESVTTHSTLDCRGGSLIGRTVGVDGLGPAKTDALLRLELADGRSIDTVLRAREPSLVVPDRDHAWTLAGRYVGLGIEHILTGYDHLLFVFGLLLLATSTRALVATISAFTAGYSITLTLAVLDLAQVPPAPVAALIAASIFVLAVELARPPSRVTLMRRRPWLMALLFGLLHGLGFAGTLRAAGLPADAVPLALLCFNVGIELGQLAFVLAVLAVTGLVRPATARFPAWTRAVPVYAMGSLAAFWLIGRTLPLLR